MLIPLASSFYFQRSTMLVGRIAKIRSAGQPMSRAAEELVGRRQFALALLIKPTVWMAFDMAGSA